MSRSATQFSSTNQPKNKRTKTFRTLMLESVRRQSLLETNPRMALDKVEGHTFDYYVKKAFGTDGKPGDDEILKRVIERARPMPRPTMEPVKFKMPENTTLAEKCDYIAQAVADGALAPDVGKMLIDSIKGMVEVLKATEFEERLKEVESELDAKRAE